MNRSDEDIQYQLSQLLDGQLGPERADALLKRMEQDSALAEEFRLYQSLEQKLSEQAHELPAVDWELQRETIRSALERETLLKTSRFGWAAPMVRWAAVASAAAAVLVLALWLMPGGPASTVSNPQASITVAYERPVSSGEGVVTSALIAPAASSAEATVAVALQPGRAGKQNVQFERTSALSPAQDLAGTVVISVGAREETASVSNWLFRDFQ